MYTSWGNNNPFSVHPHIVRRQQIYTIEKKRTEARDKWASVQSTHTGHTPRARVRRTYKYIPTRHVVQFWEDDHATYTHNLSLHTHAQLKLNPAYAHCYLILRSLEVEGIKKKRSYPLVYYRVTSANPISRGVQQYAQISFFSPSEPENLSEPHFRVDWCL